MDISRLLAGYEVEYHVLQEEIAAGLISPAGDTATSTHEAEALQNALVSKQENETLERKVRELQNQLHETKAIVRVAEANLANHQAMYTRLERQVRSRQLLL